MVSVPHTLAELRDDKLSRRAPKLNPADHDHCAEVFERDDLRQGRLPEPPDHHVLLRLAAANRKHAVEGSKHFSKS
jgi:hypothetical protein